MTNREREGEREWILSNHNMKKVKGEMKCKMPKNTKWYCVCQKIVSF